MPEFVQPNLHVVAIHFPIGLLTVGVLIEALSFLGWRRLTLRIAGRWMTLLGAILCFPAIMTGLYALRDVSGVGASSINELINHSNFSENAELRGAMWKHLLWSSGAAVVALGAVTLWIALANGARRVLHVPLVIVLLLSVAGMSYAAHEGGEMVHQMQVSKLGLDEARDASTDQPTTAPTTCPAALRKVEPFAPPVQVHVWLAGLAIAVTTVAVGCSIRATVEPMPIQPPPYSVDPSVARIGDAFANKPMENLAPVPASRVWLIAIGAIVLTLLAGVWYLASDLSTFAPRELWAAIATPVSQSDSRLTRRLAHVIIGVGLLALPVMLLILTRTARRGFFTTLVVGALLALLLIAQAWVGTLLLLDSPEGSVVKLNAD